MSSKIWGNGTSTICENTLRDALFWDYEKKEETGRRNIQQRHDQWWNDFSRHTENRQALEPNVWSHVACAARKSARVCVRWGVICTRAVWNTRIRRTSLPCAQCVSWHQTCWSRFRYRNFLFDSPFLRSLRHGDHHVHWCSWMDYEFSLLWTFRSGWRHYPCFDRRVNRSFVRILELVIFSPNPMPLYKRIFLGASPQIFPRILARKDYAHEVHMFWIMPCDGLFLSQFFWCALGEFDHVFWSPVSFVMKNRLSRMRILRYTTQLCRLLQ